MEMKLIANVLKTLTASLAETHKQINACTCTSDGTYDALCGTADTLRTHIASLKASLKKDVARKAKRADQRYIVLFADEFDCDTWLVYCDTLGVSPLNAVIAVRATPENIKAE